MKLHALPNGRAVPLWEPGDRVPYALHDQRIVRVDFERCRGELELPYQLKDGGYVTAVRADEAREVAYRAQVERPGGEVTGEWNSEWYTTPEAAAESVPAGMSATIRNKYGSLTGYARLDGFGDRFEPAYPDDWEPPEYPLH